MPNSSASSLSIIELALQSLREERTACVKRLEIMLGLRECGTEVEGYLRRIDNINAALIRLADIRVIDDHAPGSHPAAG